MSAPMTPTTRSSTYPALRRFTKRPASQPAAKPIRRNRIRFTVSTSPVTIRQRSAVGGGQSKPYTQRHGERPTSHRAYHKSCSQSRSRRRDFDAMELGRDSVRVLPQRVESTFSTEFSKYSQIVSSSPLLKSE